MNFNCIIILVNKLAAIESAHMFKDYVDAVEEGGCATEDTKDAFP